MDLFLKKNGVIQKNGKDLERFRLNCLAHSVRLEEGFTLRSFFKMMLEYPILQELDNFAPYYTKEALKCDPTDERDTLLVNLINIMDEKNYNVDMEFEETQDKNFVKSVFSYTPAEDHSKMSSYYEMVGKGKEEKYGISLCPLQEIIDCPIEYNDCELVIMKSTFQEGDENPESSSEKKVSKLEPPSLFNFIDVVMIEVGFHGTEENKQDIKQELQSLINDIEPC